MLISFFNTWQVNLILFLIFFVAFITFYKLAVKNTKRDGAATVVLQVIAGLSILFLAPFYSFQFPKIPSLYLIFLIACIFYSIGDRFNTTARKNLEVSFASILGQLLSVFILIYGFILFKEPIFMSKIVGMFLIVFGNIFLLYKGGRISLNKYSVMAIAATFFSATAISIDINISKNFNLPLYISLTLLIPAIVLSLAERIKPAEVLSEFLPDQRKYYLLSGISWGLAIFFSLRSFQFGTVTTISPLQATSTLIAVVIGYIFLRERDDLGKKILAALIIIIGIYFTVH